MKKNGKKARQLAKQKQIIRQKEESRAGAPFSRVSKKRQLCTHYKTIGGGICVGVGWTYLYPVSESKCRCQVCKMEFTMEQYRAMRIFVAGYSGQRCTTVGSAHTRIQKIVPPVWYYQLGPDSVKTIPFSEEEVALPNNITYIM